MNASKKMTFRACLVLAASLLLWNPLQASAGAGMSGGDDQAMQGVSGKVVETMNSGGYTYVLVEKDATKTWVALPQSAITVGSVIACKPGMEMNNFKSTSLNRSFESIVFSEGLAPVGPVAASAPAAPSTPSEVITVSKADGPSAQTVGEIFEKKDTLANKPVAIQGKVVKVSRGIMGKNWLHLQDGTGSQAAGTNDLVVTTDSLPEVGAVVTIKGNLSRDRDFGAGYRYGVIIENAEVTGNK
ncbi:MAG: OB-fold nucleic acid binding domain-containing protein [Deltaproteobacteria bacterium]|nr:OB-fold nucleic acid binding domain-containing protein [Deltaproteobacteria bacterium]